MRKFKKIKLTPLTEFESLDLKVASQKGWDITSYSTEKQQELLDQVMKLASQSKDKGIIVAGSRSGDTPFVINQIKAAQNKKKIFSFAEPNPVRLYYNNANKHLEEAYKQKNIFTTIPTTNQALQGEVFSIFFGEISLGIITSIMTIEGFINQLLSDTDRYNINGKQMSKSDIEWLDFNTKIREVIPVITGINILSDHKTDYDNLSLTNSLRDDLIHLKKLETANFTNYESLFKRLLDFDPVNASDSVFNFVNTVRPNYFVQQD